MKRLILPILLALIGLAGGLAAGFVLRPAADPAAAHAEDHAPKEPEAPPEYAKLSNQFIVPLVEGGRVNSLVVLSLSLEVKAGNTEAVFAKEPKLRDSFLKILFDHANSGGFAGSFTDGGTLEPLRHALRESARSILPDVVQDVLVTDIARQDS